MLTNSISNTIINNANAKEFIGKNEVKAKENIWLFYKK